VAAAAPASTTSALGWLHTSGTKLVNAAGRPVRLFGAYFGGLVTGSGPGTDSCGKRYHGPRSTDIAAMHLQGFNIVRLGFSWSNLEPQEPVRGAGPGFHAVHTWNAEYLALLDRTIAQFAANGISVVLDLQQSQWSPAFKDFEPGGARHPWCEGMGVPTWLYPDTPRGTPPLQAKCEFFQNFHRPGVPMSPQAAMAAAWRFLAVHYASDPTVIGADLLNEPGWSRDCPDTGAELVAWADRIGHAINVVNPHMLVIVEDGAYANYTTRGFLLAGPLAVSNAVYSWHAYPPDWSHTRVGIEHETGADQLAAHLARATALGMPFWIGEFNAFNYGYNSRRWWTDPNWQPDLDAMLAWARTSGVSWSWFAYREGGEGGSSLIDPHTGQAKPDILAGLQRGM
jgi:aryl-phospho-beta-D-glucosidase BglC (GH1 family)